MSSFATVITNGAIDGINGTSLLIFAIGIVLFAPRAYASWTAGLHLSPHSTLIGMNEMRSFIRYACFDHEIIY